MSSRVGHVRVLVVERSPVVQRRLRELLAGINNIDITCLQLTADEVDRDKRIKALEPDVLILDVPRPASAEMDLLRAIRGPERPCNVIALTNDVYPETRRTCLDNGADYVFNKSIEFPNVMTVLLNVVKKRIPS